jgi:cell division protein FtsL
MATRRLRLRGRSIAALLLAGFVLTATGVITRRGRGREQLGQIERLRQQREKLVAERESLERSIIAASGRARLTPIAEQRLKLSVATGSQLVILPRRTPRDSP